MDWGLPNSKITGFDAKKADIVKLPKDVKENKIHLQTQWLLMPTLFFYLFI